MKIKDLLNAKLLTGVAVIGVGATIFFAVRETKKAVAAEPMPKDQPIYKIAYKFAWMYKGTILSAAVTVGSIIGAQKLNEKQIALMSGTIGYLAANRDKAEQFIAANGAPEVVEAYDEVKNSPVEKVSKSLPIEETGNGDILFREMYTGRWFHSNVDAVEQAIVRFKDRFDNGATLCMNDFYQELGLMGTTHGCTIGWNPDLSSTRLLTINVKETYYVDKFGEVHRYNMIEFGPSDYPYNYYRY